MTFSKSFGYAVRSILYLASNEGRDVFIQIEEIAEELAIPRHYLGKILKMLAKEGILSSAKGPYGGFRINEKTMDLPLIRIVKVTNGLLPLKRCVLNINDCDPLKPCALHYSMEAVRGDLIRVLSETTVKDVLPERKIMTESFLS